jgi:uncharacterized protein (DUF433 family)
VSWRAERRNRKLDLVRAALSAHPDAPSPVIARCAGIGPARVYVYLAELETAGEVTSRWADGPYPRRRLYRLGTKMADGYDPPSTSLNPEAWKHDAEIWIDRGRMSGQPCAYGSRVPIETLVRYADACGDDAALEAYPSTTAETLAAARWFLTQWQRTRAATHTENRYLVDELDGEFLPNAEDCPRCDPDQMSYPFICPGHPAEEGT